MAPYLFDMRVIRRITESVKPEVLVDSGLILVLILYRRDVSHHSLRFLPLITNILLFINKILGTHIVI